MPQATSALPGRARRHRTRILGALAVAAIAAAGLVGCGGERAEERNGAAGSSENDLLRVTDDSGRDIALERSPRRIVSLVPSATGILLELGRADRLVGRTDYDDAPEVQDLPSVGGGLEPSIERLVSLAPDLVVRFSGESDPTTPRRLDAAGVPHLAVRPDGIEDIRRIIHLLGSVVDASEEAAAIEAAIDRELAEVADHVRGADRPQVVYLLGGDPPWVAGGGTFLHELVELAGGENLFADAAELYGAVSLEEVVRREPDLILASEGVRIPPALDELSVRRVPPGIESPGTDVGRSARILARTLHPSRFP